MREFELSRGVVSNLDSGFDLWFGFGMWGLELGCFVELLVVLDSKVLPVLEFFQRVLGVVRSAAAIRECGICS